MVVAVGCVFVLSYRVPIVSYRVPIVSVLCCAEKSVVFEVHGLYVLTNRMNRMNQ